MSVQPQILVAIKPAVYRDLLASELPRLRPGLAVRVVDPADLDDATAQMRPRLVICSELTDSIREFATASIVLDSNGLKRAVLTVDGQQQVLRNPRLTDLLAAVDAAVGHGPATAIPPSG
jgi:hypothetical protein